MKAKIKPRINLENRTRLEEVIPLSTPMILFVDPSNVCNFKCTFCPTGDNTLIKKTGRSNCIMNFNLYKKIIDNLKDFNKPLKVLRLYKEGEPLLNPHLSDMIKYAKDSGYVDYIDTTTNGYLLHFDKIKSIIDAGIDKINISVNGMSDKQFLKFSGIKVDFNKYVKNITDLYEMKENCEIVIKIVGDYLTNEEKTKFYDTFGNICDRIFIENLAPCWPNFNVEDRLGITIKKGIYDQEITNDINICPYIFYSIIINSDGSVSLCFLDWEHKLIIGNVQEQSLKEIWEGNNLFQHRINHLHGRRKENNICKQCGQLSHCLPDNIDSYAKDLIIKLT
ncbi:SPASM domain-containing protein [Patescibacteria group bacterium]|nr:SPASM domain-containing protein [Patescibacteria group bacterium]MBU0847641.1 SPASM domain-containing protein [Patescibacteria group bacterium]